VQVQFGQDPQRSRREPSVLLRFGGMGTEFAFGLVGLLLVGMWVDHTWHTSPRGAITGVAIGIIGGGYNFIRQARNLMRAQEAEQKKRLRQTGEPPPVADDMDDESDPDK
jgi:hypothetical protein